MVATNRRPGSGTRQLVYVVQSIGGGPVKIGASTTKGLAARLGSLQSGSPLPLRLLLIAEQSGKEPPTRENEVHRRLRSERLHLEWFDNSRPVIEYLLSVLNTRRNLVASDAKLKLFERVCGENLPEPLRAPGRLVLAAHDLAPATVTSQPFREHSGSLESLKEAARHASYDLSEMDDLEVASLPFTESGMDAAKLSRESMPRFCRDDVEIQAAVRQRARMIVEGGTTPKSECPKEWRCFTQERLYFPDELRDWLGFNAQQWMALLRDMQSETGYTALEETRVGTDPKHTLHSLDEFVAHVRGKEFLKQRRKLEQQRERQRIAEAEKQSRLYHETGECYACGYIDTDNHSPQFCIKCGCRFF